MLYVLKNGRTIDTSSQCSFEERNFLQKMIILHHMRVDSTLFRNKWRAEGNPVWRGPDTVQNPGPAAQILLDLEASLKKG